MVVIYHHLLDGKDPEGAEIAAAGSRCPAQAWLYCPWADAAPDFREPGDIWTFQSSSAACHEI